PPPQTGGAFVAEIFPYVGPVLLFVATGLAAVDMRGAMTSAPSVTPARFAFVPPSAQPVTPSRARLASAVPMPLHAQPAAGAPTLIEIAPGTAFESYEQEGEFVHVRSEDFDGYLPAWSVRRAS